MGLPTGILAARALHRVRKTSRSSREPLIVCAGASQGAGREGVVGSSLSNYVQRLVAVREWLRAKWCSLALATPAGIGGVSERPRVDHLPCTAAQ